MAFRSPPLRLHLATAQPPSKGRQVCLVARSEDDKGSKRAESVAPVCLFKLKLFFQLELNLNSKLKLTSQWRLTFDRS